MRPNTNNFSACYRFEIVWKSHWKESGTGNRAISLFHRSNRAFGRSVYCPRVLSIYQEVKNNMAANLPTLAIYVDYQKAYDRVWHNVFLVKLFRLSMPLGLLKVIASSLKDRRAYVAFGETFECVLHLHRSPIGMHQCQCVHWNTDTDNIDTGFTDHTETLILMSLTHWYTEWIDADCWGNASYLWFESV